MFYIQMSSLGDNVGIAVGQLSKYTHHIGTTNQFAWTRPKNAQQIRICQSG